MLPISLVLATMRDRYLEGLTTYRVAASADSLTGMAVRSAWIKVLADATLLACERCAEVLVHGRTEDHARVDPRQMHLWCCATKSHAAQPDPLSSLRRDPPSQHPDPGAVELGEGNRPAGHPHEQCLRRSFHPGAAAGGPVQIEGSQGEPSDPLGDSG